MDQVNGISSTKERPLKGNTPTLDGETADIKARENTDPRIRKRQRKTPGVSPPPTGPKNNRGIEHPTLQPVFSLL